MSIIEYFWFILLDLGVDFQAKNLYIEEEDITIKAMVWDTSGSERYRAITVGHYRDALGAILVFDVTDQASFNNLDYWLDELRNIVSSR